MYGVLELVGVDKEAGLSAARFRSQRGIGVADKTVTVFRLLCTLHNGHEHEQQKKQGGPGDDMGKFHCL